MNDVTDLLNAIDQGKPQAASQLLPLVYDELRRLAAARIADEPPGQTLDATALVHLHHFAGMPHDQVAAALELSVYQVRQKWTFARAWLKAILEES